MRHMVVDAGSLFQSTLPRRERLQALLDAVVVVLFQSTLPRGERRKVASGATAAMRISIHAPAKGATADLKGMPKAQKFQSTLEGNDLLLILHGYKLTHFNPRSREGSDRSK